MPPQVFQPLVEVFLLVEQPRQRLSHWSQALAPLDGVEAPPVATVDVYYDPTSNQAIFGLRYDQLALGADGLKFLVEVALLAEIGMIQPAELSEADRGRFVGQRLARCTMHVGDQRKIVGALVELVRRVRSQQQKSATTRPMLAAMPSASRSLPAVTPPAGDRGDVMNSMDPIMMLGRSAARDAGPPTPPQRSLAHGSVRKTKQQFIDEESNAEAIPEVPKHRGAEADTAPARRLAAALPPRRADLSRPAMNVVARTGVHRAATVLMPTVETLRMLEAASGDEADDGEPAGSSTDQYLAALNPSEPATIHARYLRNGRWIPIRIGALSLKGAALMACALPRIDDHIDVALSYGDHRALVRGAVGKVATTQEAAASGTTTFNVSFELDDSARRELTALLTAARADNVMLKLPPARSTRRFPVEWPVCLGTPRGAVRADALDVSADGMFVRPLHAITLEAYVTFSVVLDDGLSPISGRARVARNISDAEAKATGLMPGYGLSIIEMSDDDRERWAAFLGRVEQRAARRVLIGAAPARLAELQHGLVAAGYAVIGGCEPSVFAQLASAEAHPVDVAVIDASWLTAASSTRVEPMFSSHKVPCVTVHGDAQRARIAVDRLLSVV